MSIDCSDCNNLEEKIYWTHFQSVQFVQILSGNYEQQLAIPKKFAKKLGQKLTKEVSLKVPSGAIWSVGLLTSGDTLFIQLGWKEFVKANSLVENDMLIFKYTGNSQFDVSLFDGENLCEKEASYFVRKCGKSGMSRGCRKEENLGKTKHKEQPPSSDVPEQDKDKTTEVRSESSSDATEWTPSKRPRRNVAAILNYAEGDTSTPRAIKTSGLDSTVLTSNAQKKVYLSNRRPVTEEEKENALQRANAAASENSLVLVMQDYQVYRGFYLTIPARWADDRIERKNMDIILQDRERAWKVRYTTRGAGGMMNVGWKNFAFDNLLEEFDVCLFNLAGSVESKAVILDVSIFLVVEEAVPLTPPPSLVATSKMRGRKPQKHFGRIES